MKGKSPVNSGPFIRMTTKANYRQFHFYTVPLFSVPDVVVYPGLLLHLQPLDEPSLVHLSCYEHIPEQLAQQYHTHVHGGLTCGTHDKPPGHMEHKTAAVLVLGEMDTWLADEPL
jgi:hypothetical protein